MASSSSSSSSSLPRTWKYNVFTSFHGPDVRKTFLSHLRTQFNRNGITMFDDQRIERSDIIAPALKQAIRESRISIVVLSKKYASSSWCLDELLEILKCKEDSGQIVMTVFYGVDPSHVRKQSGDFGDAFNETCAQKTEKKDQWSEALTYVGNIAGEDFKNCENEAKMIEKIARDVSDKLTITPSRDFEEMVGLEAHLEKVKSMLDLDNVGVKITGISGPAGIGKSTIARALHSRLSHDFPLSCFMDNIRGRYHRGSDEYTSKLWLQEQLLSKIVNLNGMTVRHLGAIEDRLHDQKVFIILDDVERLDQLEALANIGWFGHGSRIIVTTENKEILQQHGIDDIYHVGFPSGDEALKIFCLSAFRQTSPPDGFVDLADEVVKICSKLPLGLHILGSSLRDNSKDDWIEKLPMLKKCLDGRIESVLKVGYEGLNDKDQVLFLFIAVFFNYEYVDHVTSMLAKSNWEFRLGLKTLANKYLVEIDGGPESKVVMHHLLQVMASQVIYRQESWKRQILVDPQEICTVLENEESTGRSIVGVSFDVAEINDLMISPKAFVKMCNLFFLKVYNSQEIQLHIPEGLEFPRRLRLLHWEAYPEKSLPHRFIPVNLVELEMPNSQLEKLWEGTQPLANLKKMNLSMSSQLKELPNLSNATNLESLSLISCTALAELPPSISNLHKLYEISMHWCKSIEFVPTLINLASLRLIAMIECSQLRSFPDIPTNIMRLNVAGTLIEEVPASLTHCCHLESIDISGSVNLKTFLTDLPTSVKLLFLCNSSIERITDCIKDLHNLQVFDVSDCKRLVSLPELPGSLKHLQADDCESLERVSWPLNTPDADLFFTNCFKLDQQARQAIIQRSFVNGLAFLPGREVPAEFDHRARGNVLRIPHSAFNRFKVCVVISSKLDESTDEDDDNDLDEATDQEDDNEFIDPELLVHFLSIQLPFIMASKRLEAKHLMILQSSLPFIDPSQVSKMMVLQFISNQDLEIIECGIQILMDEIDECGEASKEKDEDIAEDGDYKSVSRKRITVTSLKWDSKKPRF